MSQTLEQRRNRIVARIQELRFWIDRAAIDLDNWQVDGEPLAPGGAWPSPEGVVRFTHGEVTTPEDWPLADVRLDLQLGGEGLVSVLYGDGRIESWGLDPNHERFPLHTGRFTLEAECVARLPFGRPVHTPRIQSARLVLVDSVVERLVRQLRLLVDAVVVLGEHPAVTPLIEAGERALAHLQWPSATDVYIPRVASGPELQSIWALPSDLDPNPPALTAEEQRVAAQASDRLEQECLALRRRFPPEGSIALSGHAHLDLAWLWPLAETRRKARRTFSTILQLMDRYPEFRFNQSSAQIYAFVEEDDPALFARIREKVANGQWEPVGGMWVEPDINMSSGESLVRQLLYGQRYFQRTFGVTHSVCWLPDCFGFSPGLPQILRLAGIDHFFTIKLTWSQTNQFPFDLFWWEGLDGSRVLAHMFNNPHHQDSDTSGYNGDSGPWALVQTWRHFRGKERYGESLLSIGYGDGGGGVTPEMIEQVRVVDTLPAVPLVRFTEVRDFFQRMEAGIEELPVWVGEMYLELHRGTLTSQGRTKYLHRRSERDLVAAEALATLCHLRGGPEPPSLEDQWRILLRNEFHDILPGSSIREVYQLAERELEGVVAVAAAVMESALDALTPICVPAGRQPALLAVNPDLSPRPLRVESSEDLPGGQRVEGGTVLALGGLAPGLGYVVSLGGEPPEPARAMERELENLYLRVLLAADGTLARVWDKRAGRDVLAGAGNSLWTYVDKPVSWDAWDIDADYVASGEQLGEPGSMTVVESGPHRATIRVVWRFRGGRVQQDIRLWANSPRLEFHTTLDWHDRRWLLKARFPLAIRSSHATFETAFGVQERPTHRNTTWETARFEVAAHRFADLSEPDYGVALLNDGKYGYHVVGNELGISLLRSPIYPDPLADEGRQSFTYALLPHAGSPMNGGVLMEAEDLNRPLLVRVVAAGEERAESIVALSGTPLGLGCLKRGEDTGSLILRAYEPHGARGTVDVRPPEGWEVAEDLDLLERSSGDPQFSFTPFQLRTWRLSRSAGVDDVLDPA